MLPSLNSPENARPMSKDHTHVLASHIASFWRVKHKSFTINGETWSYLAQGDPSAEPIIFIHGMGTNKSVWRSQMQNYDNKTYYRIALNIPGACFTQYLKSQKHSIHDLCRWLDQTFEILGIKKTHIVAHSTLTLLATFYAATRPQNTKSLTLMSIPDLWGSNGTSTASETIQRFRSDISYQSVDDSVKMLNSLFYNPPQLPKAMHKAGYTQHQKFIDHFLKVINDLEQGLPLVMPQTKNIKCPLLIINGESDTYSTPELINSLHWHYPNANTVNLLQCGHLIMLEKPKEIYKIHIQFLTGNSIKQVSNYGDVIQSYNTYASSSS